MPPFDDPGNLSWGVTNDSLADVFNQYDASDVTVVTDMNTGRSRGFGFVTVPSSADADAVSYTHLTLPTTPYV